MRLVSATSPQPYASDVDHLQAEVEAAAAKCRRIGAEKAIERIVGREGEPEATFRAIGGDDVPIAVARKRVARLRRQERRMYDELQARLTATRAGRVLGLDRLCATHDLDEIDRQILVLAAIPSLSRQLADALDGLEADGCGAGGRVTAGAALGFVEAPLAERVALRSHFRKNSALVRHDLIRVDWPNRVMGPEDLWCATIRLAPSTFGVLVGDDSVDDELLDWTSLETPRAGLEAVVLPETDRERILATVDRHDDFLRCRAAWGFDDTIRYGNGTLILFSGPPGTGKTLAAHGVAHAMGRRILRVDVPLFVDSYNAGSFLPNLYREARLQNAVLLWDEADVLLYGGGRNGRGAILASLLTELERADAVSVMATNRPEALDQALLRRVLVHVRFGMPDAAAREQIWRKLLPYQAPIANDVDLRALAATYALAGGHIKNALLAAVADAVRADGDQGVLTQGRLERAAADQLASANSDAEMRGSSERDTAPLGEPRRRR